MTIQSVCEANVTLLYSRLIKLMRSPLAVEVDTRNGRAKTLTVPLAMEHLCPNRRVLFDPARNANPVFHLMESLWMLAGNNDVEFVRRFNKQMYSYSDDGQTFNAAYGHRWRKHFGIDQVLTAIEMLRANPLDRRVVIGMWDPASDLGSASADIPCNTQIMFRVVGACLDMTTTNRSNDLIWGLMGANCVHLSMLHEFVAHATGNLLGKWYHLTNNLHVYEQHFPLLEKDPTVVYQYPTPAPLVSNPTAFLADCQALCEGQDDDFVEPFFDETVAPMVQSWEQYRAGYLGQAHHLASCIGADDWRLATTQWYARKMK